MDYLKIYNDLVNSRKQIRESKKTVGYELHHIIPKCLGGNNSKDNLVLLTYKEHYIAHHLLIKIYPKNVGINYGFLCMLRDRHGHRLLTARMVETIKNNYSSFQKWHIKVNNPMRSESAKKKISDRMKKNNPNKGGISNHTAYPVRVYFNDGTHRDFEYMAKASEVLNIPYSSMKQARRFGEQMKKYNITKVEKIK
jgi:hypothetical protein